MTAGTAKERKVITDKAVLPKTGKTIQEWFAIFDGKGAKEMDVDGIYQLIGSIENLNALSLWNQALLTNTYQWDRGLRQRGEKANGFEISVSKTIAASVEMLFAAWLDHGLRAKWLPDKIVITRSTEFKSVRAVWSDKATRLSIDLYSKGDQRSQIVVQHMKIPDAEMAAAMKEYWGERLNILKTTIESL